MADGQTIVSNDLQRRLRRTPLRIRRRTVVLLRALAIPAPGFNGIAARVCTHPPSL